MKVVIAGHWQTRHAHSLYQAMGVAGMSMDGQGCHDRQNTDVSISVSPNTAQAHQALALGIRERVPDVSVDCLIFGGGEDFPDALAQAASLEEKNEASVPQRVVGISIPVDTEDARSQGARVSELIAKGTKVILEGGHGLATNLWASFLEGAAGLPQGSILTHETASGAWVIDEACVRRALLSLRELWAENLPDMACSTQRPLVGMASVMATSPDLTLRTDTDPAQASQIRHLLRHVRGEILPPLPMLNHEVDPACLPGSGAGGGVGAVVATIGGALIDTGRLLAHYVNVNHVLDQADVLVVTEPMLHSPHLAEATLDTLTAVAAEQGIPCVAVGVDSTLSRHEMAQWGLHGTVLCADTSEALGFAGQRIAHTWLRRRNR